jgi:hypothetical protein
MSLLHNKIIYCAEGGAGEPAPWSPTVDPLQAASPLPEISVDPVPSFRQHLSSVLRSTLFYSYNSVKKVSLGFNLLLNFTHTLPENLIHQN